MSSITQADYAAVLAKQQAKCGRPIAPTPELPKPKRAPSHTFGVMNALERAYADHLEMRRLAGEIAWYAFEPGPMKLANRCEYNPDFIVVVENISLKMEISFHDTKPRKSNGRPFSRDDSIVKIKWAAKEYDWARFEVVWPTKDKRGWERKAVRP